MQRTGLRQLAEGRPPALSGRSSVVRWRHGRMGLPEDLLTAASTLLYQQASKRRGEQHGAQSPTTKAKRKAPGVLPSPSAVNEHTLWSRQPQKLLVQPVCRFRARLQDSERKRVWSTDARPGSLKSLHARSRSQQPICIASRPSSTAGPLPRHSAKSR